MPNKAQVLKTACSRGEPGALFWSLATSICCRITSGCRVYKASVVEIPEVFTTPKQCLGGLSIFVSVLSLIVYITQRKTLGILSYISRTDTSTSFKKWCWKKNGTFTNPCKIVGSYVCVCVWITPQAYRSYNSGFWSIPKWVFVNRNHEHDHGESIAQMISH